MSYFDGNTCPYCDRPTKYVDSKRVYKRSYGMIYYCADCQAWVCVHKGTNNALGRLANAELREWKQKAHKYFDPLWQKKMKGGFKKHEARRMAYRWLAGKMGINTKVAHIGMFDVDQCKQVVELCKPYYHEQACGNKSDRQPAQRATNV